MLNLDIIVKQPQSLEWLQNTKKIEISKTENLDIRSIIQQFNEKYNNVATHSTEQFKLARKIILFTPLNISTKELADFLNIVRRNLLNNSEGSLESYLKTRAKAMSEAKNYTVPTRYYELLVENNPTKNRNVFHYICENGDEGMLNKSLLFQDDKLFQIDSDGYAPLHLAIKHGHLSILEIYKEHEISALFQPYPYPEDLLIAVINGKSATLHCFDHLLNLLKENEMEIPLYLQPLMSGKINEKTLISYALDNGRFEVANFLRIKNKPQLDNEEDKLLLKEYLLKTEKAGEDFLPGLNNWVPEGKLLYGACIWGIESLVSHFLASVFEEAENNIDEVKRLFKLSQPYNLCIKHNNLQIVELIFEQIKIKFSVLGDVFICFDTPEEFWNLSGKDPYPFINTTEFYDLEKKWVADGNCILGSCHIEYINILKSLECSKNKQEKLDSAFSQCLEFYFSEKNVNLHCTAIELFFDALANPEICLNACLKSKDSKKIQALIPTLHLFSEMHDIDYINARGDNGLTLLWHTVLHLQPVGIINPLIKQLIKLGARIDILTYDGNQLTEELIKKPQLIFLLHYLCIKKGHRTYPAYYQILDFIKSRDTQHPLDRVLKKVIENASTPKHFYDQSFHQKASNSR